MKLWAVIEDRYDGKDEDLEYHEYYDNQLKSRKNVFKCLVALNS